MSQKMKHIKTKKQSSVYEIDSNSSTDSTSSSSDDQTVNNAIVYPGTFVPPYIPTPDYNDNMSFHTYHDNLYGNVNVISIDNIYGNIISFEDECPEKETNKIDMTRKMCLTNMIKLFNDIQNIYIETYKYVYINLLNINKVDIPILRLQIDIENVTDVQYDSHVAKISEAIIYYDKYENQLLNMIKI